MMYLLFRAFDIEFQLSSLNENNDKKVILREIKGSFRFLSEQLAKDGIMTNLDDANIIRLDLFLNLKTKYPFKVYKGYLKTIKLTRKEMSERENSFLFSNKQNQLNIYDKKKELEQWKIYLEDETMRFENRFMTKNKVKAIFGDKLSEVILNKERQLKQMDKLYHEIFDNTKGIILVDENLTDIISKSNSRKELKNNLFYYALSKNSTTLTEAIITKHFSKTQAYKIKKEIENYSKQYAMTNNFDLYNELKTKYENELNHIEQN